MTREVHKAGLRFLVDDAQEAEFWGWFDSPTWEPDTVEAMRLYVDDETFCVDAGAWIGDTVLLAAPRARRVVAFEPDHVARAALERNLGLNPTVNNVEVRAEALSDRNGEGHLDFGQREGDSLTKLAAADSRAGAAATAVTLLDARDFFAAQRLAPGDRILFKIDVEGSEYEIVPALGPFIRELRPHLLISFHPNLRYRKDGVLARIASGSQVLRQNWRVLRAVRQYRHHFAWDASTSAFRDHRAVDLRRLWLPLPLRSSLLIGTYLFTDEDRRVDRG